jgi:FkbM family methyltransferase
MESSASGLPPAEPHVVTITRRGRRALFALLDPAEYIQSHHAAGRFYEEDLLAALCDQLRPGDLVVDVGANIGNHTIFFAAICECRVLAIEPDPDNFAHLEQNVQLNHLGSRVTLIRGAASDSVGASARIVSRTPGNSGAVSVALTDEDTGIPSVRLDDLDMPDPPKLVKVDTEGMDLVVLEGGSRLLAAHGPVVVVEAGTVDEYDAVAGFLGQFSYLCLDARNPTPTFVFAKRAVGAEHEELVQRITTSFAHQRIALSDELARVNLRARELREAHERTKTALATSEQSRKESQARLEAQRKQIASLEATRRSLETSLNEKEAQLEDQEAKARRLSAQLTKTSAERDRALRSSRATADKLEKTSSSESYQLGNALVKAFAKPGKRTLLLPWTLISIIFRSRRQKAAEYPSVVPATLPESVAKLPTLAPSRPARLGAGEQRTTTRLSAARLAELTDLSQLRVAAIMDEFTFHAYGPECRLLQVTPDNWQTEMADFEPDLLFVESAWRGVRDLWDKKISHAASELVEMVAWCRERGIPTVFWNKEDPVHFQTFTGTAKLFDHVFTTDIDCVSRYKTVLGSEHVHLLLFACQPRLHNPLETYERKHAFCFAGAYYTRYPERIKDLETFVETLTSVRALDIYDRNFHEDHPDYAFPEAYKQFIVGHLPPDQIDRAYKGYRYGINLNSIKQSQTMFARRVYELLASNTVTLSNFSRGLRLLFGDLVISTDNGVCLHEEVTTLLGDESRYRKLRLAALRKVMTEHTYRDRLAYVAEKALGVVRRDALPQIVVTAAVGDDNQLRAALGAHQRQQYPHKSLVLVLKDGYVPSQTVPDDVRTVPWMTAQSMPMGALSSEGFVAGLVPGDYHGPHYLLDLALATRYSSASAIGKRTRYRHSLGACGKQEEGNEYRAVGALPLRAAIVSVARLEGRSLTEWLEEVPDGEIGGECLSVDEFNYCQDHAAEACPTVDDLELPFTGLAMADLEAAAEAVRADDSALNVRQLSGRGILELLGEADRRGVTLEADGEMLQVSADLGGHEYLYAKQAFAPTDLGFDREVKLYFDVSPGLDVRLAVLFLDGRRRKIGSCIAMANRNYREPLPEGTRWLQFGLRVAGGGACTINALVLGNINVDTGVLLARADVLVLTNHYPHYSDLYRNAFVHRRVLEYRKAGRLVDVFSFNAQRAGGYYEFNGIDVICGYKDELQRALSSGRYRKILVHFLDPDMWEILRQYIDRTQVIVWVHGSEVQPRHRREYNFTTEEQRRRAIEESDRRIAFWRAALGTTPSNLHFVFVSQYFADEVMEDVGIRLREANYTVIHNVIDCELFAYRPKSPGMRTKILSIRPYASRKYANDLTVKAILELSKEPFFDELEVRLIGDGRLFEETVSPLHRFPNVTLERGFLRQEEIAALHREYGIFLVPTRMDAQGVSRDEAMASGLVPITNRVAAIPEFVDEECGILVDAEDHAGLARAIARLYHDPDLFLRLSAAAAERVRRQSSRDQTIARELALVFGSAGRAGLADPDRRSTEAPPCSGDPREPPLSGDTCRLVPQAKQQGDRELTSGQQVRRPIPKTAAEMRDLGFVVVPPDQFPPDEDELAKQWWSQRPVAGFYREHQPWVDLLRDYVAALRPKTVMEFGCNVGRNLYYLRETFPELDLLGVDINSAAVEYGRAEFGLDLEVGDERIFQRFEADSFDLILTLSVLDHIAGIRSVCRELLRCSRHNVLCIEVSLPLEGKVSRHFDHRAQEVMDTTPYSYSWDYARVFRELGAPRVDVQSAFLHETSLHPYYKAFVVHKRSA